MLSYAEYVSCGNSLLDSMYSLKTFDALRINALSSVSSFIEVNAMLTCAVKKLPGVKLCTFAGVMPSTRTFTNPLGIFNTCNIFAITPVLYRFFSSVSSTLSSICVSNRMNLSDSIDLFIALMDDCLPARIGKTMYGNTTRSFNGNTGSSVGSLSSCPLPDWWLSSYNTSLCPFNISSLSSL